MAEWYEDESEREPKTLFDMFLQSNFFQYSVIIFVLGLAALFMSLFMPLIGAIGLILLVVT